MSRTPSRTRTRDALRAGFEALVFVLLYLLLDWVSYIHPWEELGITVWNPPSALSLALLLRRGPGWALAVFAAALSAEFLIHIADTPVWVSIGSAAILAAGYAGVAMLLLHTVRLDLRLSAWRDLLGLIVVIPVAVLAIGAIYVYLPVAAGLITVEAYPEALGRFWIGEVIGILATLPLLIVLTDAGTRKALIVRLATPETAVQFLVLTFTLWAVFGWSDGAELKWFYVLFLPIVWISMRHGLLVTTLAVQWVEAGLIVAIYGLGYPADVVEDLQLLLLCITLTGLILGITVQERQHAMEELKRSMRLVAAGEMAATVVHELNQPLTALGNYSEVSAMMIERRADPGELVPVVHSIIHEVGRVGQVLSRLRDFLRSGATQLEHHEVREMLLASASDFRLRAQEAVTEVSVHVSPGLPDVYVDRVEIGIVLRNLLANALDSVSGEVPGQRSVALSAERFGHDQVCVRVADSGEGVQDGLDARIFDPFVTSKAKGMGLGLTISRSIVEAHGGRLWFERGDGMVFCFTLPVVGEA
jgi:signal transduction histidine kinase